MGHFAGYIRVSRVGNRGDTLLSPEQQEREILIWANARGHVVDVLPAELDRSGADDSRPVLQGAIERVARGDLDGVIVWNFARFTRSLLSSIEFLLKIEEVGGELHSTSQQIDAKTPAGRMQRNFYFSMAQAEREEKAEGFAKSKLQAIERGIWTAPVVPFGWRKNEERHLVPHPVESVVRAEVIRRRGVTGDSWKQLADYIREQTGRAFLPASVARMVKSRTNIGEASQGEYVNPHAHPAIVDRATFEAAQVEHPKPARGTLGPALLTGVVRCAGCQRRMTTTVTRGHRSYGCRGHHAGGSCTARASISAKIVDPYVQAVVLEQLAALAYSATERNAAVGEAERLLAEAEAELVAFQESVRVVDVAEEFFGAGMKQRAGAVQEARRALAGAKLAAPSIPDPSNLGSLWPDLDVVERRHLLSSALSVVWVRSGRGAAADRVRLIEAGAAPEGLSTQGRPAGPPVPLDWPDVDLPGEVRPAAAKDREQALSGAVD